MEVKINTDGTNGRRVTFGDNGAHTRARARASAPLAIARRNAGRADNGALTLLQSRFVRSYLRSGATNATRCAVVAGYAARSAHVTAHRLLHNPKILRAINDEAERMVSAGAALGASVLAELAEKAHSERVRALAAQALLRNGRDV